jgi:hypothetical protein
MPTICPKCRTLRPVDANVPDWQCPACGVAYAKAGGDPAATLVVQRAPAAAAAASGSSRGVAGNGLLSHVPWGKLLAGLAIVHGAWLGFHRSGVDTGNGSGRLGANPTVEQLAQLAASSQPSDVLMYSATWCPNCSAAKSWMGQYGFKSDKFVASLAK